MQKATAEPRKIPMILIERQAADYISVCQKKVWYFSPRQTGKTTMLASYVLNTPESLMVVMNTKIRDVVVGKMGVPVEKVICSPNDWKKVPLNTSRKIVIDDFDFERVTWRMPEDWWDQVQIVTSSTLNFDYIQTDRRLKFQVEQIVIHDALKI